MTNSKGVLAVIALGFAVVASPAMAIDCENRVILAETAVKNAQSTMEAIEKPGHKARVRILVDDAQMMMASSKRLCSRSNATNLTKARATAQANSAIAWAEASKQLTREYEGSASE